MPISQRLAFVLSLAAITGGGMGCNPARATPGGHTDAGHHMGSDGGIISGCTSTTDSDHNGIADSIEDPANTDDDGDGVPDTQEIDAGGNPCGPRDTDHDHFPDFRDTDSDNDGVPDGTEIANGTDPTMQDTDGDGVTDLVELAAMTDGHDRNSVPPAGTLYVTVPYYPPGTVGTHPHQQFDFQTRIQSADVFILVDNSNSMDPIIASLRGAFSTTIVPGLRAQIPDLRVGVGSFDSVPMCDASHALDPNCDGAAGMPGDYTLWVRQPMDADTTLSQTAFNEMQTIAHTSPGYVGASDPEDSTEAIYESITGAGMTGHETDMAARYSVHDARDPAGDGFVPTMVPGTDCPVSPDGPAPYGWACFVDQRVPIIVLASDAAWWNGFSPTWVNYIGSTVPTPTSALSHTSAQLLTAMQARGAFFIGIDVGNQSNTYANATILATMTGTVDGTGAPVAFNVGSAGIASAGDRIVAAITTLAGQTRQDITTRTDPDTMEHRLVAPHTTADFIRAVTPDHGFPDMPTGYRSKDTTTFYDVDPATRVWFDVDFYNDFQPPAATALVFRATIQVLGRAHSIVDHRDVYMIVPPEGGTIGPM